LTRERVTFQGADAQRKLARGRLENADERPAAVGVYVNRREIVETPASAFVDHAGLGAARFDDLTEGRERLGGQRDELQYDVSR
jgi:hypothetical protein